MTNKQFMMVGYYLSGFATLGALAFFITVKNDHPNQLLATIFVYSGLVGGLLVFLATKFSSERNRRSLFEHVLEVVKILSLTYLLLFIIFGSSIRFLYPQVVDPQKCDRSLNPPYAAGCNLFGNSDAADLVDPEPFDASKWLHVLANTIPWRDLAEEIEPYKEHYIHTAIGAVIAYALAKWSELLVKFYARSNIYTRSGHGVRGKILVASTILFWISTTFTAITAITDVQDRDLTKISVFLFIISILMLASLAHFPYPAFRAALKGGMASLKKLIFRRSKTE